MIRLIPQLSEAVLIGTTISRYRLVGRLAKGGMGEVYEAEDTIFPRRVALKFIAAEAVTDSRIRERFQREIQALSTLNHRNICTVHDAGEYEGRPYLVMERLEGKTLADELSRTPLDVDELLSIGIQVCEGLSAAHQNGIIHRDIKPSNIMLTQGNQVKILDFGLAKIRNTCGTECVGSSASTASTVDSLTDRGALLGTLPYMSPEQALGKSLDERSDLFSLGVVLYELATGHHPFRGETVGAVCDALIHKQPAPPLRLNPALPVDFDGLLRKALEKDPRHRFQSAGDFASELRRIRHEKEVESAPRPEPAPRPRPIGSWIRYAVFSLAAVLALVLGVPEGIQWISDRLSQAGLLDGKTVAVMPFELVGEEAQQQRDFCEGLARDLTIVLQQLSTAGPRLMVTSYRLVKDLQEDELYRERGVELAVLGSLAQDGNDLIVRLSLSDTRTGASLGTERLSGSRLDRNELARRVQQAALRILRLEMTSGSRSVLAAEPLEQAPDLRGVMLEAQGLLERYDDQAHVEQAIEKFSHVVSLAPNYAPAHSGLGLAYATLYRHDQRPELMVQARDAAGQALRLDPEDPSGHLALGLVLSELGRYEEAIPEFDRALQLSPDDAFALNSKARALARIGKMGEAETTYRKAIELRPEEWAGYFELGAFLRDQGRYDEALRQFEHFQRLLPESVEARNNIAVVYLRRHETALAQAVLREALKIRPDWSTYDLLGTTFFYQDDFEQAAQNYERAAQDEGAFASTLANLCECYKRLGRPEDAASCYGKAALKARRDVEVNPRNAFAVLNLSDYLAESGDSEQARYFLSEALKLPALETDPEMMFIAAEIFELLGDRESAIDWALRSLGSGFSRPRMEESPSLAGVVSDPRFRRRLAEAKSTVSKDRSAEREEQK